MRFINWISRNQVRLAFVAASLSVSACDAVNEAVDEINDIGNDADVHYYLSVGTSLSRGVQPNGEGVVLPTDDGYPDFLHSSIRPAFEAVGNRELRLVKLGCPGETLETMTDGGSCLYVDGSQLEAAVDFLADNAGKVHLVTIDMGGNDFRGAGCFGDVVNSDCVDAVNLEIAAGLATVLAALREAAGPDTTIIGMNYYNPYLASWLEGDAGQELAVAAAQAVASFNGVLGTTYETAGIPLADVALAFLSDNFTDLVSSSQPPPNDVLPVNVNNICEFTYMCAPDPRGPDIHANDEGYSLIADTFEAALP